MIGIIILAIIGAMTCFAIFGYVFYYYFRIQRLLKQINKTPIQFLGFVENYKNIIEHAKIRNDQSNFFTIINSNLMAEEDSLNKVLEKLAWIRDNSQHGRYILQCQGDSVKIYFKNQADIMAFKLIFVEPQ